MSDAVKTDKPTTFTERFLDLERRLGNAEKAVSSLEQNLNSLMPILSHLTLNTRLINEQLQAIYDLSDLGQPLTRSSVIKMANQKRVEQVRALIDADLAAGLIKAIDEVKTADDIIVYNSEDVLLAFQTAQAFEQQSIKIEDILGKKVGDTIGKYTIVEIYEVIRKEIDSNEVKNVEG